MFKIPLSFHYTGWLIGIPRSWIIIPSILASAIPELIINQHLSVISHLYPHILMVTISGYSYYPSYYAPIKILYSLYHLVDIVLIISSCYPPISHLMVFIISILVVITTNSDYY